MDDAVDDARETRWARLGLGDYRNSYRVMVPSTCSQVGLAVELRKSLKRTQDINSSDLLAAMHHYVLNVAIYPPHYVSKSWETDPIVHR